MRYTFFRLLMHTYRHTNTQQDFSYTQLEFIYCIYSPNKHSSLTWCSLRLSKPHECIHHIFNPPAFSFSFVLEVDTIAEEREERESQIRMQHQKHIHILLKRNEIYFVDMVDYIYVADLSFSYRIFCEKRISKKAIVGDRFSEVSASV